MVSEVERGAKLPGLYPMNDEAKARYEGMEEASAEQSALRHVLLLSKILGFFAMPSNLLISIGLIGVLLLATRFAAHGRRLMAACLVLLAVLGLSPVGNALILPLEQRFPPWDAARGPPDGIIVLGGSSRPRCRRRATKSRSTSRPNG